MKELKGRDFEGFQNKARNFVESFSRFVIIGDSSGVKRADLGGVLIR
jgi:hypothetical protein